MTPDRLRQILEQVAQGALDAAAAFEQVKQLPFEDLGFAKVDHHRALRSGLPGGGAGHRQDCRADHRHRAPLARTAAQSVLITRLTADIAAAVIAAHSRAALGSGRAPRLPARSDGSAPGGRGTILVVAAGTADLPVAEEAAITAELMGQQVERIYDVGVAGIHRLFAHHERLRAASVLIVVAGMEGALPSVVGGLVDKPLIAVPTSIGYGASFGGLAALLAMLNSCAAGVTVVNIDNGFGAGVAAALINRS